MDIQEIVHPITVLPYGRGAVRFFHSPRLTGKPDAPWIALDDLLAAQWPIEEHQRVRSAFMSEGSPAMKWKRSIQTERGAVDIYPTPIVGGFLYFLVEMSNNLGFRDISPIGVYADMFDRAVASVLRVMLPGRTNDEIKEYVSAAFADYQGGRNA